VGDRNVPTSLSQQAARMEDRMTALPLVAKRTRADVRLIRKAKNAVGRLRHDGILATARYASERFSESYHEWRLGIRTTGKRRPAELGIDSPYSEHYYPSDYRSIYKSFRHVRVRPHQDVFLDFGAGMGRVLAIAATLPFRRVIGVEISPELCAVAAENLRRARGRLKCQDVQLVTADAATYQVPSDVSVIFFFNPFSGPVLSTALANIRESVRNAPRKVSIIFKNPTNLGPGLGLDSWLHKTHEFHACDADHPILILETRHAP
jgi:SAM-dependent methyltransferase